MGDLEPLGAPACRALARAVTGILFALPAAAQIPNFGAQTPDTGVAVYTNYDQVWCDAVRTPSRIVTAWSAGQDVFLRLFDLNLQPLANEQWVNSTLHLDIQDEPAVGWSSGGHGLVAWSDRFGYDGEQMGIFGRVFDANGAFLAPEFQINQLGLASQWRPLIAPRLGGGFLVAYSADWDGDAYFRILSDSGAPQGNEVRINAWEWDAQVDPSVAQASNGTIFAAFVDFSGHGNIGAGLNLWGRTFDAAGNALQPAEFAILPYADGDQREPRVAVDGHDRFVVVYQDNNNDGSGNGIMCRRFDITGAPLALPFRVNLTTVSDQVEARVVAFEDGGFIVSWMDFSSGVSRVRGRRFDGNAQPLSGEFKISENVANCWHHNLTANVRGTDVVAAYDATAADTDVYVKRFKSSTAPVSVGVGKLNSEGCLPSLSYSGTPSITDPNPFWITGTNLLNNKYGFLVYGFESSFTPYRGGTWLVGDLFRRGGNFVTGGNPPPNDCSGVTSYDFNARIQSGVDSLLLPGQTVSVQLIYRDGFDPTGHGIGLTDSLRFAVHP